MTSTAGVKVQELTQRVQEVYRSVAEHPERTYHFELGRGLAERLGYPAELLDQIPAPALESFAGVGYVLDLAAPAPGDRVLDLGSGSGTDVFATAALVGPTGHVTGLDITVSQLAKAERLRAAAAITTVEFREGRIEQPPLPDASVDLVISNGVVNLSADKAAVFPRSPACWRPVAGSPSPTSSPTSRSPNRSSATPSCGPRASAAPRRSTSTGRRSRRPGFRSKPCATTRSTSSCPAAPRTPPPPTASPASGCSPSNPPDPTPPRGQRGRKPSSALLLTERTTRCRR